MWSIIVTADIIIFMAYVPPHFFFFVLNFLNLNFIFQLQFAANIILHQFQVYSVVVDNHVLHSVPPPSSSSTHLAP